MEAHALLSPFVKVSGLHCSDYYGDSVVPKDHWPILGALTFPLVLPEFSGSLVFIQVRYRLSNVPYTPTSEAIPVRIFDQDAILCAGTIAHFSGRIHTPLV
jgi:hypothetical protein